MSGDAAGIARRPGRRPSLAEANSEPAPAALPATVRVLNAIMKPFTRTEWSGTEKLPPTGGLVVVANHISNTDPLAIGQFLAYSGRWPHFLAKSSLFRVPGFGSLLRATQQLPVHRNSREAGHALTAAVEAVRAGQAVIIYPEGTITHDPELWPMRGKTGAARIAFEANCPVIPVGQWGAQELMHGRRIHFPHLLPPKTLRIKVGDPVPLADLRSTPLTAFTLTAATDRIMAAITDLVAELRGETPPVVRYDPRNEAAGDDVTGEERP
jgi:1-acyl-sn-glycerol-3-phosphate acyltransferase